MRRAKPLVLGLWLATAAAPAPATWSIVAADTETQEVPLTLVAAPGVDRFLVTLDDGRRPVVLPPRRTTLALELFSDAFESGDTTSWSISVGG